jgi:PEGA domain-containing protein
MKRTLLILALAVGIAFTALPASAAIHVLADHGHGHVGVSWGWPGWGWGWGWGWGYPGYGYGYAPYGYPYGGSEWSRVKTDVEPEEAWLYLDGRLIGTADDFDGWPDYLYLARGHYRLEFRLPGFETRTVEIDSRPGQTFRINDHLKKVSGAKEHGSYEEPKIEGGIQRYWAKRRDVDHPVNPGAPRGEGERAPYYEGEGEEGAPGQPPPDWRGGHPAPDARPETPRAESHGERSRLHMHIEPADAAVYVDDRFVGTAGEVSSLDRGIPVPAGKHTVTVSRPGYKDRSVDVEVGSGASETVNVSLTR